MKGNYGGIHAKQNNGVKAERKSRQAVQQQNQVHFGAGVEKHTESPKVAPISQIAQYGSSDWLNSICFCRERDRRCDEQPCESPKIYANERKAGSFICKGRKRS